jgi:malonate transporter MadM subunit
LQNLNTQKLLLQGLARAINLQHGEKNQITEQSPLIGTIYGLKPKIGLNNPTSAMVYGGLVGTTSGVAGGLAATDVKLVPYGAMTATFYTGLGTLLCPSIGFMIINAIF